MSVVQIAAWKISCKHPDGCDASLRLDVTDKIADEATVRAAARERGWDADDETKDDRCPRHRDGAATPP